MAKMKIVGDPQKAATILNTNRPLTVGTIFAGFRGTLEKFAETYPEIFEMLEDSPSEQARTTVEEVAPAPSAEEDLATPPLPTGAWEKNHKPKSNKMFKKQQNTKGK